MFITAINTRIHCKNSIKYIKIYKNSKIRFSRKQQISLNLLSAHNNSKNKNIMKKVLCFITTKYENYDHKLYEFRLWRILSFLEWNLENDILGLINRFFAKYREVPFRHKYDYEIPHKVLKYFNFDSTKIKFLKRYLITES